MTTPDLTPARLEELLAAATPGPWTQHLVDETLVVSGLLEIASTNIDGTYDESFRRMAADAALIALSPALAARVIELQEALGRYYEALRAIEVMPEQGGCDDGVDAVEMWTMMRKVARTALETPNAK